mgnify:CR=1 FL=1
MDFNSIKCIEVIDNNDNACKVNITDAANIVIGNCICISTDGATAYKIAQKLEIANIKYDAMAAHDKLVMLKIECVNIKSLQLTF